MHYILIYKNKKTQNMSHFKIQCLVIMEFYSKITRVRRSFTLFPTEFYSFSDGVTFFRKEKSKIIEALALKT